MDAASMRGKVASQSVQKRILGEEKAFSSKNYKLLHTAFSVFSELHFEGLLGPCSI